MITSSPSNGGRQLQRYDNDDNSEVNTEGRPLLEQEEQEQVHSSNAGAPGPVSREPLIQIDLIEPTKEIIDSIDNEPATLRLIIAENWRLI